MWKGLDCMNERSMRTGHTGSSVGVRDREWHDLGHALNYKLAPHSKIPEKTVENMAENRVDS